MNSVSVLVLVALTVVSTSITAVGSAAAPAKTTGSVAPVRSLEIVAVSPEFGAVVQRSISAKYRIWSIPGWVWRGASANYYLLKPELSQQQLSSVTVVTSYYF